jgi:hypothetical protein
MTDREFAKWVQSYYGDYPEGQKRDVWEYIKTWQPEYLDALKKVLLANYSSQYKRPPDIEAMTKLYTLANAEQEAEARRTRLQALPPPKGTTETDDEKAARLHADMEYCNVTMQTPGWFAKVLQYRIDRGDYRDSKAATKPGGVIKSTKDVGNPKPLTSWEELGNYARV